MFGKFFKVFAALFCMAALLNGCSVYMASNQPTAKNLDLLKEGTPRTLLIAEYGVPLETKTISGTGKCEVFKFTQGYSSGAKASRAVLHGIADVFTLGLWEVIGTPAESVFSGNFLAYEVCYDDSERAKTVVLLNPPSETNQQPSQQGQ